MDFDRFREIYETLRTGKLRTALTAFSVAWGIFMLVILLGAGNGLQNGVEHAFADDAENSIWIYPGRTGKNFAGFTLGRQIQLTDGDYEALTETVDEIEHMSGRYYLRGEYTVRVGSEVSSFDVRATHPGHQFIENTIITGGRFLNDRDIRERRKVAVIGPKVKSVLFGARPALGKWLEVGGVPYLVVGTFEDTGRESEQSIIYLPITTARMVDAGGRNLNQIMFTIGDATVEQSILIEEGTRRLLARRQRFDPTDQKAVRVRNNLESAQKFLGLFAAIRGFIWIVGIGTIIAGIVGVSNIMLISVRERTKEIGLRKALGATPRTIVSQILLEALLITGGSGYGGLLTGMGVLELVRRYAPPTDMFRDPEADLSVVLGATVLLIVSGMLAGYFPARIAARVNPVVALRTE